MEDHKSDDPDCSCELCELVRHVASQPVGLFHKGTWLGNHVEPLVFTDLGFAELAARTMALRLGVPRMQIEILPFPGADTKISEEETEMSGEEAMKILLGEDV